jgi:transcriptional regulator with PAS, ATPase and Fis domain
MQSVLFSLPVLNKQGVLIGVLHIKDLLKTPNNKKNSIASYISQEYLCLERPNFFPNAIKACLEKLRFYTELYIVEYNGMFVDVISTIDCLKGFIKDGDILSTNDFLRQILRPTSLARCILDNLEDGVIIVNKQRKIMYINTSYKKILGVKSDKAIGKRLDEVEPGAIMLNVLETGLPIYNTVFNVKSVNVQTLANIIPICYNGECVGAISIFSSMEKVTDILSKYEEVSIINKLLLNEITEKYDIPASFSVNMIGKSSQFCKQLLLAAKVSSLDAPVLILGESGTGKELVAQAIHENSARKHKPLISINCAAIPDHLFESELFGYEGGAFTDAKKTGKIGKFEQANNGSIFLDEIGDMPLNMQIKLLRFLQDNEVTKIGSLNSIKLNVRIIAATNKNLEELVEKKLFREDLYHRLNVFAVKLPPIRERKIDVFELIKYYHNYYEQKYSKKVDMAPSCLRILLNYRWPGNAREVKNLMENLIVINDKIITVNDLPGNIITYGIIKENAVSDNVVSERKNVDPPVLFDSQIKQAERQIIMEVLVKCNNNKTKAMEMLGISRRTFYKKLKSF